MITGMNATRPSGYAAWRALGVIALLAVTLSCTDLPWAVATSMIIADFITTLLLPPTRGLPSRAVGCGLATTIVFLSAGLLFTALVWLLVPPTASGITQLNNSLGSALNQLHTFAADLGLDDTKLRELLAQGQRYLSEQGRQIATGALAGARTLGEIVIGAVLSVILSIYFVHGGDRLFDWLVGLTPVSVRPHLRSSGDVVFHVIGRYIHGVALVGLFDGTCIGVALWILGVPIALPLAVLTFLGAFLPVIGAFSAGLLAAVVAFVAKGWLVALIVVAVTILIQQLEGHVLAPQVYGKALALPGAVILLSIALGSVLAGITGAFLAAPVASAIVAVVKNYQSMDPSP